MWLQQIGRAVKYLRILAAFGLAPAFPSLLLMLISVFLPRGGEYAWSARLIALPAYVAALAVGLPVYLWFVSRGRPAAFFACVLAASAIGAFASALILMAGYAGSLGSFNLIAFGNVVAAAIFGAVAGAIAGAAFGVIVPRRI